MTAAAVTCGQTLARTLRDAGVTHMFGLPGGEIRRAPVRRTRRFVAGTARAGATPSASGRVGAASGPPVGGSGSLRSSTFRQTNDRRRRAQPVTRRFSEGCRGPWRRSCLRCVGRGAEGGGRSAVAGVPCSVWKRSSAASSPRSTLRGRSGASPSRRDDNSRGKVQNVRGDSSAPHHACKSHRRPTHCL